MDWGIVMCISMDRHAWDPEPAFATWLVMIGWIRSSPISGQTLGSLLADEVPKVKEPIQLLVWQLVVSRCLERERCQLVL